MAVTPLIKPITSKNGTFYAFQSAINDSNLIGSQEGIRFSFSKYALLRIPEIGIISEPDFESTSVPNKTIFKAVGDSVLIGGVSQNQVTNFSESFQNYCLNLEAVLLSQPEYKSSSSKTVAESVFFKWLKELGCIRFRESNNFEKNSEYLQGDNRFVEEDELFDQETGQYIGYNKVIKYINDISAIHTNKQDSVYTEIYIYTPTDHGSTPHILFKSKDSDNYKPNKQYINVANSSENIEYLSGRTQEESANHPFGLNIKCFFDRDNDELINYEIWDESSQSFVPGTWFGQNIDDLSSNSYLTDLQFGNPTTQRLKKTRVSSGESIQYLRTQLDGIGIDWDLNNYKLAKENSSLETLNDFNSYVGSKDFEYNAILVYYDLVDLDDPTKTTTNLYGVYFLNTITPFNNEHIIPVETKYKPDILDKTNGNATSYKINLKSDTSFENVGVIKLLNTKTSGDYNTFSMDLFVEALTSINNTNKMYDKNLKFITDLYEEMTQLKSLFIDDQNKTEILQKINTLEQSLISANSLFETSDSIMQNIQNLYKIYNDILNNNTTLDVRYNLEKSAINSLVDFNQQYNIDISSYKGDFSSISSIKLMKYNNYYKHINPIGTIITSMNENKDLLINDSEVQWSYGQTFRLVFGGSFSPMNYKIFIKTDHYNRSGLSSPYSVIIGELDLVNFTDSGYNPIFEIICIDPINFKFEIDQIK